MLTIIRNYLINVLVRAIIGFISFILILLAIFVIYIVFTDWSSAVKFMAGILDIKYIQFIIYGILFISLFKADTEGNRNLNQKKPNNHDLYFLTKDNTWL